MTNMENKETVTAFLIDGEKHDSGYQFMAQLKSAEEPYKLNDVRKYHDVITIQAPDGSSIAIDVDNVEGEPGKYVMRIFEPFGTPRKAHTVDCFSESCRVKMNDELYHETVASFERLAAINERAKAISLLTTRIAQLRTSGIPHASIIAASYMAFAAELIELRHHKESTENVAQAKQAIEEYETPNRESVKAIDDLVKELLG